jgi:hypothetical protein
VSDEPRYWRLTLEVYKDARARVTRGLEAMRDGDQLLGETILEDWLADSWQVVEHEERRA